MDRTPIPTTLKEAHVYAQKNGRIVVWAGYGDHIDLTCINHPDLRWSTKNIGGIGARSVFYVSNSYRRCSCEFPGLQPVIPNDWEAQIVPLLIIKCRDCGVEICEEKYYNPTLCKPCFDKLLVEH